MGKNVERAARLAFAQRSGVLNLGVEGQMLLGAFAAFYVALTTGNLWLGVLAAISLFNHEPVDSLRSMLILVLGDSLSAGYGIRPEHLDLADDGFEAEAGFADGIDLFGISLAKNIGGVSLGAEALFLADWPTLVLDAMGYDVVIVETVGVGQDEVEIVDLAHTTAVVSLPGMGDDIQAMKAGILEIGEVFIVNKADKPGADEVVKQLNVMLEMRNYKPDDWRPRVLKTVAVNTEAMAPR